jgi:hypothetical protein
MITRRSAVTLRAILARSPFDGAVRRGELGFGDRLVVRTRNSVYRLWALGDGSFAVSGGWFDRQRLSPATVTVNGCTHGGSALHADVVAAPGLFLEFGNRVSTTRILSVRVEREPAALPG